MSQSESREYVVETSWRISLGSFLQKLCQSPEYKMSLKIFTFGDGATHGVRGEMGGEKPPRTSLALGRVNYKLVSPDWFLYSVGVFRHIFNCITHLIIASVIFQVFSDLNMVRTESQHPSWHLIKHFMYLLICPGVEFIFLTNEWCCDSRFPLPPSLKTEGTFSQF